MIFSKAFCICGYSPLSLIILIKTTFNDRILIEISTGMRYNKGKLFGQRSVIYLSNRLCSRKQIDIKNIIIRWELYGITKEIFFT